METDVTSSAGHHVNYGSLVAPPTRCPVDERRDYSIATTGRQFRPREVYHALEAISDTSKKLFGNGSPAATDTLRTTLLERGWDGFDERWQDTRDSFPANAPQRTRLEELRNDLGHHVSHLNCAERLREGRSIDSGQIEGACQNLIGRRLKQTATRWRVRRDPRSLACVPAA